MKKVLILLVSLLAMTAAGPCLKAQEVSIMLHPEWNWIGYPFPESVDLGTAFGGFEPLPGDVIESYYDYSEYVEGYGWFGGVDELHPGWGYMYFSNRTEAVNVVLFAPTSQVSVATATPTGITAESAIVGVTVTVPEGMHVFQCGVCWSTMPNPDFDDSHTLEGFSTGSFTSTMTGLSANTTYYVRAYTVSDYGLAYGSELSFTTIVSSKPTVTTKVVSDITQTTAACGGNVTSDGGMAVTQRGICWSTSSNPTVNGNHTSDGAGTGSFTSNITGLTPNTTYYVRAYATNAIGTSYGTQRNFKTLQTLSLPSVTTNAVTHIIQTSALGGGNVTSDGGATITARGVCWSTSQNPTISDSHTTLSYAGTGSFTTDITGLTANTTYYVRAYATNSIGTAYGNQVSFMTPEAPPTGGANGLFSVSATQQVYFSQGNLQYQASTNTWRFAENQYDKIGASNGNISSTYNGWIDLFGWGTSGYSHGAICYQPWSTTSTDSYYQAYGIANADLCDQTGQADWGYNPISNGGGQVNQWRTLTTGEWSYVFNLRSTASGKRYAKATVNGVKGVILLPDNWDTDYYNLSNTNTSGASFSSNMITSLQWNTLEQYGAVFLPAAGNRGSVMQDDPCTTVVNVGSYGYYWSATSIYNSFLSNYTAYALRFHGSGLNPQYYYEANEGKGGRCSGYSVRLVRDAE